MNLSTIFSFRQFTPLSTRVYRNKSLGQVSFPFNRYTANASKTLSFILFCLTFIYHPGVLCARIHYITYPMPLDFNPPVHYRVPTMFQFLKRMWGCMVRINYRAQPPSDMEERTDGTPTVTVAPSRLTTDEKGMPTAEPTTTTSVTAPTPSSHHFAQDALRRILDIERLSLQQTAETAQNDTHSNISTHSLTPTDRMAESTTKVDSTVTTASSDPSLFTPTSLPSSAAADVPALPASPSYDAVAARILLPISPQLKKLTDTTTASMPPPGLNAKSQIQLVKERLLPIGEFIVEYINNLEQKKRGSIEMRLW
jgi:hypothetical protein